MFGVEAGFGVGVGNWVLESWGWNYGWEELELGLEIGLWRVRVGESLGLELRKVWVEAGVGV